MVAKADLPHLRYARTYLTKLREIESERQQGGDAVKRAIENFRSNECFAQVTGILDEVSKRFKKSTEFAVLLVDYVEAGRPLMWISFQFHEYLRWMALAREAAETLGAWFLSNTAATYLEMGEIEQAIASAQQALRRLPENTEAPSAGLAWAALGVACVERSEFKDSVGHFQRAVEVFRKLGRTDSLEITLQNFGRAHLELGNPERAEQYFDEAEQILRGTKDTRHQAHLRHKRALLEIARGHLSYAEKLLGQSLVDFKSVGDYTGEAYVSCALGDLAIEMDKFKEAEARYQRAVKICTDEIRNPRVRGEAELGLARVFAASREQERARTYAEEAERQFVSIGNKVKAVKAREFIAGEWGIRKESYRLEKARRRRQESTAGNPSPMVEAGSIER